jgi:hypothetical protein
MKRILFVAAFIAGIFASDVISAQSKNYGATIDENGAMSMKQLLGYMSSKEEMQAKVIGTVEEVCQAKGCWMIIPTGEGHTMRVTFKDYGFFVPKDIAGKQVIISGKAHKSTTSVEELKHYAEDAGKSKEEIAKITSPVTELAFEADGVIVK